MRNTKIIGKISFLIAIAILPTAGAMSIGRCQ